MANILSKAKNYFFPTATDGPVVQGGNDWRSIKDVSKNLSGYITPVQLQRIRHDVQLWREAVQEAEQAWYPHRVRMQRMFMDSVLNAHVQACMTRRKNLTLLKDFKLCDATGEENEDATKLLKKQWFFEFMNHSLDALFFGYSLVSLGDVKNDEFPDLGVIRRHNISPDRLNVTSYVYSLSGAQFLDEPYKDWHVWIKTSSDIGVSRIGYGLLYKVAIYEIFCRNVLGFNGDAAELYGMPVRIGKTTKTNEDERALFEQALSKMGNAGYILMDMMDEVSLVESSQSGQGFKVYENLEARCEKKISKLILGHADALDSTPGKLGATGGDDNPVTAALRDVQTVDCRFVEHVINTELLPKMRTLGFAIGEDVYFEFKNDAEREAFRSREDASNKVTAEIAQVMKNAGLQMDAAYFEERTGIPTTTIAPPAPTFAPDITPTIQNKLKNFYK
jgi:Protein of unknown function (DUF935)